MSDDPVTVTDESTGVVARKLNEEEINYIFNGIPDINSAIKTAGKFVKRKLISKLRQSLRMFVIVPSQIEALREEIYSKIAKALIPIGKPIGFTAVEAIIQPIQQMALNSFHAAGSAKNVSLGVGQITSVISASENPKVKSVSIHFKDRHLTLEQVLQQRQEFVGITVYGIYTELDIDTPNHIVGNEIPWWYVIYDRLYGNLPPRVAVMMRLTLDVNKMYMHDVDIVDVCRKIEANVAVKCVYSPPLRTTDNGLTYIRQYIDIYPLETQIPISDLNIQIAAPTQELNNKYIDSTYFEIVVIPSFTKMYIKGIEGITDLFPVEQPIWSVVANQIPIQPQSIEQLAAISSNITPINPGPTLPYDGNKYWKITVSNQRQRMSGISVLSIVDLCIYVGMTVIEYVEEKELEFKHSQLLGIDQDLIERESYLIVKMPDQLPVNMRLVLKDRDQDKPVRRYSVNQYVEADIGFGNVMPNELVNYYGKLDKIAERKYVKAKTEEIIRKNNESLALREQSLDPDLSDEQRTELAMRATKLLAESRAIIPARPTNESRTQQMTNYVYADTIGTNLKEVMARDDVNPDYTYSSHMYEILNVLGIEAVRNFLIKTINDAVKFEGYINPMSIVLLADYMTNKGEITKMTFKGLKQQETSVIAHASLEQAMSVFGGAATVGIIDDTTSTSASIALGKKVHIGTGAGMTIDPDLEKQILAELEAMDAGDNVVPLDVTEMEAAVKGHDILLEDKDVEAQDLHFEGFNYDSDPLSVPTGATVRPGTATPAVGIGGAAIPGMPGVGNVGGVRSSIGGIRRTPGTVTPGRVPGVAPVMPGMTPGRIPGSVIPGRSPGIGPRRLPFTSPRRSVAPTTPSGTLPVSSPGAASSIAPGIVPGLKPTTSPSAMPGTSSGAVPGLRPAPFVTTSRIPRQQTTTTTTTNTSDVTPIVSTAPTPSSVLIEGASLVQQAPCERVPDAATQFTVQQSRGSPLPITRPAQIGRVGGTPSSLISSRSGLIRPTMPSPSIPGSQTTTIPTGLQPAQGEARLAAAISNAKVNQ